MSNLEEWTPIYMEAENFFITYLLLWLLVIFFTTWKICRVICEFLV